MLPVQVPVGTALGDQVGQEPGVEAVRCGGLGHGAGGLGSDGAGHALAGHPVGDLLPAAGVDGVEEEGEVRAAAQGCPAGVADACALLVQLGAPGGCGQGVPVHLASFGRAGAGGCDLGAGGDGVAQDGEGGVGRGCGLRREAAQLLDAFGQGRVRVVAGLLLSLGSYGQLCALLLPGVGAEEGLEARVDQVGGRDQVEVPAEVAVVAEVSAVGLCQRCRCPEGSDHGFGTGQAGGRGVGGLFLVLGRVLSDPQAEPGVGGEDAVEPLAGSGVLAAATGEDLPQARPVAVDQAEVAQFVSDDRVQLRAGQDVQQREAQDQSAPTGNQAEQPRALLQGRFGAVDQPDLGGRAYRRRLRRAFHVLPQSWLVRGSDAKSDGAAGIARVPDQQPAEQRVGE